MMQEIFVQKIKRGNFTWLAYDKEGHSAMGFSKEHAMQQFRILFGKPIIINHTDMKDYNIDLGENE